MNLGTVWGIPIGVHFSWLVVFGLVTWSLAAGYFPGEYVGWAPAAYWTVGAVTSLLFSRSRGWTTPTSRRCPWWPATTSSA
jgi:hypothetical protein